MCMALLDLMGLSSTPKLYINQQFAPWGKSENGQ